MDLEQRRTRREDRRRELRRRRALALGALLAALVVVAVAVASGSGSGSGSGAGSGKARAAGHRAAAGAAASKASSNPARGTAASGPTGPPGKDPVPILMYHVIAAPPAGAPFPGLYVEPQLFAAQMQALKQAGWHAVTPDQVWAYWRRGVPLGPGKPIVLSFDNGYQSQYTQALPVLQRLGWVGEENIQLSGLPPSQGGLLQHQIRGLVNAGWELDTQGFSHADLVTLTPEELHYQVAVARQTVEHRYGVPVNWFCYPSGHYNANVIAEVKAAGYTGSTTVIPGWAQREGDPYRLPRLRVLGGTSPTELLSEIDSIRDDPPAPASYTGA
ncbi:MAG TPA: polysaccharide deacetylase family protein [Solirubrobacteraceae bacterium]|jgi:peptidoglycan/xylan/chitin deacetylase (PgdA/CDA1 family)|nr:polysaccharide deacetylase family protein [Solirubrobacteraceae bacterium]